MKRKRMSMTLAALLAASICLGGCGAGSGGTEKESGGKGGSELEQETIQLWLTGPGKQKDSDEVWEKFNEMLQEYVPNTTVEFTVIPTAEYKEKYNQMLASGEAVDLTWVANWVTGINEMIEDGNFMELDDLLDEYGQGIIDTLTEDVIDMHRYPKDDKLYHLISWQGLYANARAFKVPTEFAQLAGETWLEDTRAVVDKWWNHYSGPEDFQAVFDQLDIYLGTLKENGLLYGGMSTTALGDWLYPHRFSSESSLQMFNIGVEHNDDTFKVIDSIQSEHFRVYAENMAEFYKKGYIRSDIASLEKDALQFVTNGEFTPNTTVIDLHNNLSPRQAELYTSECGVDISLIPIEEKGYLSRGDATAMAIPYCADAPERAMMVLNAIYTQPDLYQLLIYGVEGEHYTDNGDGTITTPYGDEGTTDSDYGLWKWTIGTCKNALVTQEDVPGYYEELEEEEKDAYICSVANFTLDTSSVDDVIASLKAIDGEYESMIDKGYTGDDWENTLNSWIEERKAAGVDRLMEELQKQLDQYLEENNITSWISNK